MIFLKGIKLDFMCMKMMLMKNKKYLQQKFSRKVLVLQFYVEGQQELHPFYM